MATFWFLATRVCWCWAVWGRRGAQILAQTTSLLPLPPMWMFFLLLLQPFAVPCLAECGGSGTGVLCFSLFLSVGIELQRQRALTEDGVSGEMSNAGPDCSAVIKHLREDVPGRGMLTLWSWTNSSSFNYSFHCWNLLCTFDQLWDFFPHLLKTVEQPCYELTHSPHRLKQYKTTAAPSPTFSNSLYFVII